MKRRADDFGLPPAKKQRTNNSNNHSNHNNNDNQPILDTSTWGISDNESDDDDDIFASNNNNNNNNMNTNTTTTTTTATNGNQASYSGVAQKLMAQMGYQSGTSLGKSGSNGIRTPIEAYKRISSRGGLGFDDKIELKPQKHEYKEEKIDIIIKPHWLYQQDDNISNNNNNKYTFTSSELDSFLTFKRRCDTVGIEWSSTFCSISLQKKIFTQKSKFDSIGQTKQFIDGRNKANPFEGIRREIFQNRAALKICEIDRHLKYEITSSPIIRQFNIEGIKKQNEYINKWKLNNPGYESILLHSRQLWTRELIYFGDICSGPGGFSEYFLHCNKWQCRGFGFTLKNKDDFKLNKFNSNAPWDNFICEYGSKNNGDITLNENIRDFRKKVLKISSTGLHIVMADGGFDCFPDYNSQELLSKQLILCQFLCAMSILRYNGNFICKLFDCFNPFTASILYIAQLCFNNVALIKPNQSRPANSEKYIICRGFKWKNNSYNKVDRIFNDEHYIVKHLYDVNMWINKHKKEKNDIQREKEFITNQNNNNNDNQSQLKLNELIERENKLEEVAPLIPVSKMSQKFIDWLKIFNEKYAEIQIRHLNRIQKYLEDKELKIDNQIRIRKEALKYWFYTDDGKPRIVLDTHFGSRFVTREEDYNYNNNNNNNNMMSQQYGYNNNNNSNQSIERPLNTLILADKLKCPNGKQLLDRIKFEIQNTIQLIRPTEFNNKNSTSFYNYKLRGDWYVIAFDYNRNADGLPPEWCNLISTGNRHIYECKRNTYPNLYCYNKTNVNIRLPADTVVDCIKRYDINTNEEIYHIFDAWCIGSKQIYKRNFIQRQEFCRVLVQGYGSKYMKFAGAMPALQSIKRTAIINKKNSVYLWFIRNKKSIEQKEKKNKNTAKQSQYWRPVNTKIWYPDSQRNLISFDKLLSNLNYYNELQQQQIKKLQHNIK